MALPFVFSVEGVGEGEPGVLQGVPAGAAAVRRSEPEVMQK